MAVVKMATSLLKIPSYSSYVTNSVRFSLSTWLSGRANLCKTVEVSVGSDLYRQLHKQYPHIYHKAPLDGGAHFELKYYDSLELLEEQHGSSAWPLVVLLHGAPGSYEDFAYTMQFLHERRIRVVALNYPGYSYTLKYTYRHSPVERAEIVKEFLRKLKLNNVDLLLGHSSSGYTMLEILEDIHVDKQVRDLHIKTIGMFSPPTYIYPTYSDPTRFRTSFAELFDYKILRRLLRPMAKLFIMQQGLRVYLKPGKETDFLVTFSAVGYLDFEKIKRQVKIPVQYKIPTFLAYGCKDKLFLPEAFETFQWDLGFKNHEECRIYGKGGELVNDPPRKHDHVEVSRFLDGGHYTFKKYHNQINQDIYQFMVRKLNIHNYL